MVNLKKSLHQSNFLIFHDFNNISKTSNVFQKNLKETRNKSHFYFRETSPFNRFKMQIDIHWNWHRLATLANSKYKINKSNLFFADTGVYRFWLYITFSESESKKWKVLRFPDQNLKAEYFCETITNKKLGIEKFSWVNWEIYLFSLFNLVLI